MNATKRTFLYQEDGRVATITLDRPDVLNALTVETYQELHDTFASMKQRGDLQVIVLTGSGRAFCSGGDVRQIIGWLQGRSDDELRAFTKLTCDTVLMMREAPQIIIASLNGVTAGAGAALALASDFRIASEAARIAFLFVKVGLSGADMGAAHLLPRFVGLGRATELLMRGDFIDAVTARDWGLVHRVVPASELAAETGRWAESLASGPSLGLTMTKRIMNRALGFDLDAALRIEADAQAVCMKHPDFGEAYQAFLEKRRPVFGKERP